MIRRVLLVPVVLAVVAGDASPAPAATITVVNKDAAGEGFNDTTPVSPVGGNSGTTLGAQRLNAFTHAAGLWGAQLTSAVTIKVDATMDTLTCSSTSAVLGSAGANTIHYNFTNAPYTNTYYPQALANKIAGTDLTTSYSDIVASFNSAIGTTCPFPRTWYYGLDGNPGASKLDFVTVVLHELGHGLGFQTYVTLSTGARYGNRDDVFMKFLEDHSLGLTWPNLTDAQRAASAKDDTDLHWTGSAVVAAATSLTAGRHAASGHVQMYAPTSLATGSSVSHWDTDLSPNELMEPSYTTPTSDPSLARDLMSDIGWDFPSVPSTSSTSTSSSSSSTTTTSSPTSTSTSSSTSTSTSTTSPTLSTSTSSIATSVTSTSSTSATSASSTSTTTTPSITTTSTLPTTSSTLLPSTTSTTTMPSTTTTTLPEESTKLCPRIAITTCRKSASQRSSIVLRDANVDAKDRLKWRIAQGGAAEPVDFLDPVTGTASMGICVYDASGSLQPLLVGRLPTGGTCDGKPCWKRLGGSGGYRYRNRAGTPGGFTRATLRVSRRGTLRLVVKARGVHLLMTPLGLVPPVRVQLQVLDESGRTCWESSFGSALRNDTTAFKAKGS